MNRILFVVTSIFFCFFITMASYPEDCTIDPMEFFKDSVNSIGFENSVIGFIDAGGKEYSSVLITLRERTEPIVRDVLINHTKYSHHTVGNACLVAYRMGLNDLLDQIQEHAFNEDKEIHFAAIHAYVKMCPPDRFPVVLKLMETENKNIKRTLLYYALERKIVDPDLLEKWLAEQLEKDKDREVKLIYGHFREKVIEAIQLSRESLDHQDTKPAQNESQSDVDTSENNNKTQ